MPVQPILQVLVALGLFNVWLLRFGRPTAWRGGTAATMREEFAAYGLPEWSVGVVGFLKVASAIVLLLAVFADSMTWYADLAALVVAVLMVGAVAMHVKVRDPWKKSLPAASILVMCLLILAL